MSKAKTGSAQACPCGGGSYQACCGRYHQGEVPDRAEKLMRARYSAYVLGLMDFVHASWHANTRPPLAELKHDAATKWLGLDVKRHVPMQNEATVEFVARYKVEGRAYRLHEVSRFVREQGCWFYVDGVISER